jgi:hypothetical protein
MPRYGTGSLDVSKHERARRFESHLSLPEEAKEAEEERGGGGWDEGYVSVCVLFVCTVKCPIVGGPQH